LPGDGRARRSAPGLPPLVCGGQGRSPVRLIDESGVAAACLLGLLAMLLAAALLAIG
jgi:hypothetical protein